MEGGGMSFADMAQAKKTDGPLDCVQVDGMVLMRIARHCRESAPAVAGQLPVTGLLLGLDVGDTLEVTNCFAFPNVGGARGGNVDSTSSAAAAVVEMAGADLDELAQNEGTAYPLEVLRCLREINVDSNTVGWYQSFFLDSFQTRDLVETFIAYRENIKRCVCIGYDPQCTRKGNAGFKALRLSEKFLELYKDGSVTVEGLDSSMLTWNEIFEEIPITVRNSVLVEAMMSDLADVGAGPQQPPAATQDDYDRLDVSTDPFLMKNLDYLIESVDDYQREQSNLAQHQRNVMRYESQRAAWIAKRRAENAQRRAQGEEPLPEEDPTNPLFRTIAEPDRLELLLVNSQISNYCSQMETYSTQAMTKMQVLGAMKNE